MRYYTLGVLLCILSACTPKNKEITNNNPPQDSTTMQTSENIPTPQLDLEEANRLAALPLACMETQYPNKLSQVLQSEADIQSPQQLHPAFYGCFDWHSAVHGHWSLVRLLKEFPHLAKADSIRAKLRQRMSKENIEGEIAYFQKPYNQSYERTYGWAWLLQLALELHQWDDPLARELEANLQPLTDLIVERYLAFLPKLHYPLRMGTHRNIAFGMSFAYDFAVALEEEALKNSIEKTAKRFFLNDHNGPLAWEPNGYDFLSPCLEEVNIMRRVLPKDEFLDWVKDFLPQLTQKDFDLEVGIVSDREDGHLVHLDGLNFSRAWCLYGLANNFDQYHHLKKLGDKHINYSLPSITDGHYEGGHWLASFAIYALQARSK